MDHKRLFILNSLFVYQETWLRFVIMTGSTDAAIVVANATANAAITDQPVQAFTRADNTGRPADAAVQFTAPVSIWGIGIWRRCFNIPVTRGLARIIDRWYSILIGHLRLIWQIIQGELGIYQLKVMQGLIFRVYYDLCRHVGEIGGSVMLFHSDQLQSAQRLRFIYRTG